MNKTLKCLMICGALLAGVGSLTVSVASQNENLMGGYKPDEWELANQSQTKTQYVLEFVPHGQKIDSWTELLTIQDMKMPRKPPEIDALAASSYENLVKQCPGKVTWNVIAREASAAPDGPGMLFEWAVKDCPPEADQHEVARIMYGKFNIFRIAYVAKTSALPPEKRDKWIAELTGARILR